MGVKVVTKHGEEVLFPTATRVEDIDGEQLVIKDAQGELLGGVNNWDYFMKYEPPKDLDGPNNLGTAQVDSAPRCRCPKGKH